MTLRLSRRQALITLAAGAAPCLSSFAEAAVYPERSVKLLVGSPPGGPSDFLARLYSEVMGPALGGTFVIDNKPGASGTLAADAVARSSPDGHTLLVSGPASISVAPHLMPRLGYDPAVDLAPVSMLGAGAFALVAHPSLPVRTVAELIAYAKAKPGAISFGSGGNGSSGHLCTELFSSLAGIKMLHVPYNGDGQAVLDLLGGQIQLMFTAPNVAMSHVKGGKLRLLAVTTQDRVPSMPDVPSVSESGLKDFEYLGWIVTFAPGSTPKAVIESLVAGWSRVRNTPPVRRKLEELAMVAPDRLVSGEPLQQFLRAESARLGKVVRDAGIKSE